MSEYRILRNRLLINNKCLLDLGSQPTTKKGSGCENLSSQATGREIFLTLENVKIV